MTNEQTGGAPRAAIVAQRLRDQAENVEGDGWINAARYMREAADMLEARSNDRD